MKHYKAETWPEPKITFSEYGYGLTDTMKSSQRIQFFYTELDAKEWLIKRFLEKRKAAEDLLATAQKRYLKAKSITLTPTLKDTENQ